MTNPISLLGNVSNIQDITIPQFVNVAHSTVAIPEILILYFAMLLIFLVVGLVFVQTDRPKFMGIWFGTAVISLFVLLWLIFLPNTVYNLVQWFANLFS